MLLQHDALLKPNRTFSKPWGFQSENDFVNAVICVETTLTPHKLLKATQDIEHSLGKTNVHATQRSSRRNKEDSNSLPIFHDRPIDIDILLYDDIHMDTPELKIPHPLMQERDFVMIPLREILITYEDPEPSR